MSNAIIARLGLDAAGFKAGINESIRKKDELAKKFQSANARILESDNKVQNQLVGLVQNLGSVHDAGELAARGIAALGESINLSLGAGLAIGAAAAAATVLMEISKDAAKARAELAELLAPTQSPDFSSLSELETRIDKLQGKLAEMSKDGGWIANLKSALGESSLLGGEGGSFADMGLRKDAEADSVLAALNKSREDVAAKVQGQNGVMQMEDSGDKRGAALEKVRLEYAEKLGAAIRGHNAPLYEQLKIQQEIAENRVRAQSAEEAARKVSEVANDQAAKAMEAMRGEITNTFNLADQQGEKAEKARDDAKAFTQELRAFEAEQFAGFKRAVAEREKSLDSAKKLTAIMEAELSGNKALAAELRTRFDFEERIAKARTDGNAALATELETQKAITLERQAQDAADAAIKNRAGQILAGPDAAREQKRQEHREESAMSQAKGEAAARAKNKANTAKANKTGNTDFDKALEPQIDDELEPQLDDRLKPKKDWRSSGEGESIGDKMKGDIGRDLADQVKREGKNRADDIRNGMDPSRQDGGKLDIKGAIDSSTLLAAIKTAVEGKFVNQ